jgi:hypothetical protein
MSTNKLSKKSAIAEFETMREEFNFNISTETKDKVIKMRVNNIDMSTSQESAEADTFISKIMEGKIKYDGDSKKIIYVLNDPIITGNDGETITTDFRFGKFTRATQMGIKVKEQGKEVRVNLNEINFRTMSDPKCNAVLKAMTGVSDDSILNGIEVQDFNNLAMIAGYFFG